MLSLILLISAVAAHPIKPDGLELVIDAPGLDRYPTDITRNLVPKAIHSHNDYWRDLPFYTAVSHGCISVEADVSLYKGKLYVGHRDSSLTEERTFQSLYIQPILRTLQSENPASTITTPKAINGVFDESSTQTLYLFVDVKTDGESTFAQVIKELAPLRQAGYLTTYNSSKGVTPGPVTVIGTGNTPLSMVQNATNRDYFYDADLADLSSSLTNITSNVSIIASTDFMKAVGPINGTSLSNDQIKTLHDQIAYASSKGIGTRYWDTPGWPIKLRNHVWDVLLDENVTLLNADDVAAASEY